MIGGFLKLDCTRSLNPKSAYTMTTLTKHLSDADLLTFARTKSKKEVKSWLATYMALNNVKDIVPSHLKYRENNCFVNAFLNKRHSYKDLNLKYVIGGLGVNGWVEYGGKDWTKEQYLLTYSLGPSIDAHAWLEDNEGNIYDFCFSGYSAAAFVRTGKPLPFSGLIEKKSKAECAAMGLTYYPADKDTQTSIFILFLKYLMKYETSFLKSKYC